MGKRSADAEAKPDPYYAAYGLGYAGHLGYAGLGYGHFGYAGLPYVYGKYISSRSFSGPSAGSSTKMDCYQFEIPSPVLQFQCYHTKSLVMVSRKQENQSGKNPTNI